MQSILSSTFHTLHLNYIRNSRAIAVLWCVFTVCFTIINIVVFLQPWLGDTTAEDKEGYFGLFEACKYQNDGSSQQVGVTKTIQYPNLNNYRLVCDGSWTSISTSVNPIASFAIGFSALINLVCIASFLVLFLFINPSIVFSICGALQLVSTMFMILGCVIYPNNWDDEKIVEICETSKSYYSGKCKIKWAYILAIIGIFDILFLAILALVMSRRQANNYRIASTLSFIENQQTGNSNPNFNIHSQTLSNKNKFETNSFRDFQI